MKQRNRTRDMTQGPIIRQVLLFALPLMIGNVFQMLYNTVDVIVVGNYVGREALAAVGSTTMIVNVQVFFFNGFSIGAGVVVGQYFGAKEYEKLHTAVETTMAMAFVFSAAFTVIGIAGVKPMLRLMATPDDVFADAVTYLTIYFAGIAGLLIYNVASGILRAVGNTFYPILFLVITSVLNIILDLLFVIGLHAGIAGVAWATIISQFVSAVMTLVLLSRTKEVFRLVWKDLHINPGMAKRIMGIGLPAAAQSVVTAVSNVFVQSYINVFGSAVMAGWSCFNKLDQFIMLVLQSMSMAATAFVSQNIGAGNKKRADRGTVVNVLLTLAVSGVIAAVLFVYADPAVGLFSGDKSVVEAGAAFLRVNVFFTLFNCVNHVLAGGIRGRGDSRGPMVIMLFSFVGVRQVYLYVMAHYFSNTPVAVGFGYPVGWMTCCVIEVVYYCLRYSERFRRRHRGLPAVTCHLRRK